MDHFTTHIWRQGKKQIKAKAKLEAKFESAVFLVEMAKAWKNMYDSNLFEIRDMDFWTWKLTQQASYEAKGLLFGLSSIQRNKIKRKKAFHHAKTADEMLKALQKMESCFEEKELDTECWRLTQKLHSEGQDPEKILFYGKRALKCSVDCISACSYTECFSSLLMITDTLPTLGYASWKLKRYDESTSYLNWSLRNISKLESDKPIPVDHLFTSLWSTRINLALVKTTLGKGDEAVIHVTKAMETQEKLKAEGTIDPGRSSNTDQVIAMLVSELKGLGVNEQDEVIGAVRVLKESTSGGESSEGNSKGDV